MSKITGNEAETFNAQLATRNLLKIANLIIKTK